MSWIRESSRDLNCIRRALARTIWCEWIIEWKETLDIVSGLVSSILYVYQTLPSSAGRFVAQVALCEAFAWQKGPMGDLDRVPPRRYDAAHHISPSYILRSCSESSFIVFARLSPAYNVRTWNFPKSSQHYLALYTILWTSSYNSRFKSVLFVSTSAQSCKSERTLGWTGL